MTLAALSSAAETKSPCQGCKDLVDGILKGLDQTKNKNFGGGDTAWEEKKNLKYKVSETRLVEVLESACAKDNFRCNELASEKEEAIETWYKTMQDEKSLHEYLCIEQAAVCCPDGKFGENCEDCPANANGEICFGNGKCEGSGDKQGKGVCVCDEGYSGELCNDCGSRHFKSFSNDTYTMCSPCAIGCESCLSANETECLTCSTGYREGTASEPTEAVEGEEEKKQTVTCVDINECVEQSDLCPVGEYCANTEGSYTCEQCHPGCESCFGPSKGHCTACKPGNIMKLPYLCSDIDECASGAICLGMYEQCINTIGHYKCECARFFRRDPTTGQCQPDPAIYSRFLPNRLRKPQVDVKKEEEKEEKKDEASTETEAKTDEKSEEKKEEASNDEETKQEL